MKKWVFRVLVGLVIIVACAYGILRFVHSLSHETTDDAYVAGVIVPVAAEVRGRVTHVYINDNQRVEAGTRLLEIYPEDYSHTLTERKGAVSRLTAEDRELHVSIAARQKALVQAQANLKAVVAEENLARKELQRYDRLFKEEAVSATQYDQVESRSSVAHARAEAAAAAVAEAEASVAALQARLATQQFRIEEAQALQNQARLDLQRTVVVAPVSGTIARKNVDPGKYVQAGQPLLSIVKQEIWVIANFKETQIEKMTVGQVVQIKADAYPDLTFTGHIDSLQPGTGGVFSLLPPENATGNFVKVVQRLPVKIAIDSAFDREHPLWPGLSVVPTVDVSRKTGAKLANN